MKTDTICVKCKVYFSEENGYRIIIYDDIKSPFVLKVCQECAFKIKDKIVRELQK